jgi:hypothetical protein
MRLGPYLRQYPTAITLAVEYRWCYLWTDAHGHIYAVEWI